MNRFLSFALAGAAVLAAAAGPADAQQLRIGYLNSERVLAETPAFADVRATMEREFAPLREELQRLETALQAADEQFRAQSGTLTETARQQRQQALQQQFGEYQLRGQQIQQQVAAREQELIGPVMERIRGVLENVRAAGNYSFIIDPPDGLVVAVDPALDVTSEVIRRLGGTPAR
jgi:outer membrane protein